jgi:hypothetical protein
MKVMTATARKGFRPMVFTLAEVWEMPAGEYHAILTPADAEFLIQHNTHNRPVYDGDVLKWAEEMASGRWRYNGEAVKLSDTKVLLDGQNRMVALSLQDDGFEAEFLVVTGLPDDVQITMDQGSKRAVNDQLAIVDIHVDKSTASAIRFYMAWSNGWLFNDSKSVRAHMSVTRIVEWTQENPRVVDIMVAGSHFRNIQARSGMVLAAYAICALQNSPDTAGEFFQRLLDGANLEVGSPILALRSRFAKHNADRVRSTDRDNLGLIINTFNHWLKGERVTKVQLPKGGWTPDNYPRVSPRCKTW